MPLPYVFHIPLYLKPIQWVFAHFFGCWMLCNVISLPPHVARYCSFQRKYTNVILLKNRAFNFAYKSGFRCTICTKMQISIMIFNDNYELRSNFISCKICNQIKYFLLLKSFFW